MLSCEGWSCLSPPLRAPFMLAAQIRWFVGFMLLVGLVPVLHILLQLEPLVTVLISGVVLISWFNAPEMTLQVILVVAISTTLFVVDPVGSVSNLYMKGEREDIGDSRQSVSYGQGSELSPNPPGASSTPSVCTTEGLSPRETTGMNVNADRHQHTPMTDDESNHYLRGHALVDPGLIRSAHLGGGGIACQGDVLQLTVEFKGVGPWNFSILRDGKGIGQDIVGWTESVWSTPATLPGLYTLQKLPRSKLLSSSLIQSEADAAVDAHFRVEGAVNVTYRPLPPAQVPPTVCAGQPQQLGLEGSPDFTLQIQCDEMTDVIDLSHASSEEPLAFTQPHPGMCRLLSLQDAHCSSNQTVTWRVLPQPMATFSESGPHHICRGALSNVQVFATGASPWSIHLAHNDNASWKKVSMAAAQTTLSLREAGNYVIVAVQDAHCTNEQPELHASGPVALQLLTYPEPRAVLQGGGVMNPMSSMDLVVTLSGIPPFQFQLNDGRIWSNVMEQEVTITVSEAGIYRITSLQDQHCQCQSGGDCIVGEATVIVRQIPTAVISSAGTFCEGQDGTIELSLKGRQPWTLKYLVQGVEEEQVFRRSTHTFSYRSDATMQLLSVKDSMFEGKVDDRPVSIRFHPLPTISLERENIASCEASATAPLRFTLTGTPPFSLQYHQPPHQIPVTVPSVYSLQTEVRVHHSGLYSASGVKDAYCTGMVAPTSQSVQLVNNAAPSAQWDFPGRMLHLCGEAGTQELSIALKGTPPFTLHYTLGTPQGVGVDSTSNPTTTPSTSKVTSHTLQVAGGYKATITVRQAAVVSLTKLVDRHCESELLEMETVTVKRHALPTFNFTHAHWCANEPLLGYVTGMAPFKLHWLVGEGSQMLGPYEGKNISIPWNAATMGKITSTSSGSTSSTAPVGIRISAVEDAHCRREYSGGLSPPIPAQPTAAILTPSAVAQRLFCPAGLRNRTGQVQITLSGDHLPLTLSYGFRTERHSLRWGVDDTPLLSLPFTIPGQLQLLEVADADHCKQRLSESIAINAMEMPIATISGGGIVYEQEEPVDVEIRLTGNGPWCVEMSDGLHVWRYFTATEHITQPVSEVGDYYLLGVSDSNCAYCIDPKTKANSDVLGDRPYCREKPSIANCGSLIMA